MQNPKQQVSRTDPSGSFSKRNGEKIPLPEKGLAGVLAERKQQVSRTDPSGSFSKRNGEKIPLPEKGLAGVLAERKIGGTG